MSTFNSQYNTTYNIRLRHLKPIIAKNCTIPPKTIIESSSNPNEGKTCIIATIIVTSPDKHSIFDELNGSKKGNSHEIYVYGNKRYYAEDETGRVEVVLGDKCFFLVTGMVVGLVGCFDGQGVFLLDAVVFAGDSEVVERVSVEGMYLSIDDAKKRVKITEIAVKNLSGNNTNRENQILENKNDEIDENLKKNNIKTPLTNYIEDENTTQAIISPSNTTHASNFEDNVLIIFNPMLKTKKDFCRLKIILHHFIEKAKISKNVFIIGNLMEDELTEKNIDVLENFNELFKNKFNECSSNKKSIDIHIFPNLNDPTSKLLPQDPIDRRLFPYTHNHPNPAFFRFRNKDFIVTPGLEIRDFRRYNECTPLDAMKSILRLRYVYPTAPDTLKSIPFSDNNKLADNTAQCNKEYETNTDPFFIKNTCDFYVTGGDEFFYFADRTAFLNIPDFKATKTAVLLNIRNRQVTKIKINF